MIEIILISLITLIFGYLIGSGKFSNLYRWIEKFFS